MIKLKLVVMVCFAATVYPLHAQPNRFKPQNIWHSPATRTDWLHHENRLIAFDFLNSDGFYDLAISNFEKTAAKKLTENIPGLPQRHIGNPTYHPSGRYIIFQALKDTTLSGIENSAFVTYVTDPYFGQPGRGFDNDLWCIDLLHSSFYRLTTLPTKKFLTDTTKVTGILHSHFSKDGTKLLWAQAFDGLADIGDRGTWGLWQLNISDFVIESGKPKLQNTRSFKPGSFLGDFTFCESHDWGKNDSLVVFSINGHGQHQTHMDIYTLNIYDSTLTRLTDDPQTWDEHAHFTSDEKNLIWMSSKNYQFDSTRAEMTLKTDYWIMNSDGSEKQRLTFFNDPAHQHHQIFEDRRMICGDASFSTTGDSILINVKAIIDSLGTCDETIMFALYNSYTTAIEFPGTNTVDKFILNQNYPNPFNSLTAICYQLSAVSEVELAIFNFLGQKVKILIEEQKPAGQHSIVWNGKNELGDTVSSGIYFYQLLLNKNCVKIKKMIYIR